MARFLADENFPLPAVVALRLLGHDVRTLQDMGLADRRTPDDAVLSIATEDKRALLTLNRRDFFRLHRQRPEHAGIIACTFDPDFVAQARRIHHSCAAAGEAHGQLLRVNRTDD